MTLHLPTLAALYRTELRLVVRDRRTVIVSIILPLLVMPAMLLASRTTERRREQRLERAVHAFALSGERAAEARELLAAGVPPAGEGPGFEEAQVEDPLRALEQGEVELVLRTLPAGGETLRPRPTPRPEPQSRGEPPPAEQWLVEIVFRGDRDTSQAAADRMREVLERARTHRRAALLAERGFPAPLEQVGRVEAVDVAAAGQVAGLQLGRGLTLFLLLFVLTGGAVVATDTLAGEKERGTLETLLTTAAGRAEIIAAKHAVILTVALVITLIQVVNLLVYVGFRLIELPAGLAAAVPPGRALLILALLVPVAALASSVLLLTSGLARSYKEAQLYFFPVFLLGLLPAAAPFFPAVRLRSALVLLPIANLAVGVKEVLLGRIDAAMLALAWLVTAASAFLIGRAALRTLSNERLITPGGEEPAPTRGFAPFERRVVRAFAVLWAVLLIASLWLEQRVDVRIQLVINLVVLFLGVSVWLIRRYRLNARTVLALRAPHPAAWLAVVIGAPAGMVAAVGVFRAASVFLPVPQELVEAFSRQLAPSSWPLWELLLFVAVLPGICEEIAFRGVLLHGLHRRLHPVALALVVGGVFGLFHVTLFRLLPTAFLGVLLAAVTLLTGSIFPAMIWHAGNNAAGLLAARAGLPLEDLPASGYATAALVLALAFWILWRTRTPYPGLRRL